MFASPCARTAARTSSLRHLLLADGAVHELAITDKQPRLAFQRPAHAPRSSGQEAQALVERDEGQDGDEPAPHRRVLADHRVLDRVRDDEDDDELEDRELADLLLPGQPQHDDQEQVDDRGPKDDLGQARADVGQRHARVASGRAPRRIASAMVAATPAPMNRSPMLNTFANGSHDGIAKMSVKGRRAGSAVRTLFVWPAVSMPAAIEGRRVGRHGAAVREDRDEVAAGADGDERHAPAWPGCGARRRGRPGSRPRRSPARRPRPGNRAARRRARPAPRDPATASQAQRSWRRGKAAESPADREARDDADRDRVEDEHRASVARRGRSPSSSRAGPRGRRGGRRRIGPPTRATVISPSLGWSPTRVAFRLRPSGPDPRNSSEPATIRANSSAGGRDRSRSMMARRFVSVAIRPNGTGSPSPAATRSSSVSPVLEHLGDVGEHLGRSPGRLLRRCRTAPRAATGAAASTAGSERARTVRGRPGRGRRRRRSACRSSVARRA